MADRPTASPDRLRASIDGVCARAAWDRAATLLLVRALEPEATKGFNPFQRRAPDGKWSGGGNSGKRAAACRKQRQARIFRNTILAGGAVGVAIQTARLAHRLAVQLLPMRIVLAT